MTHTNTERDEELPNLMEQEGVGELIALALREDIGAGDITSEPLVDENAMANAVILSRGAYVMAGGPLAKAVFEKVDPRIRIELNVCDGEKTKTDQVVLTLKGTARGILAAERTALNFLQRMSGIATLTSMYVDAVREFGTSILDTRKTTPGLRFVEKYAVRCGGGTNHRMGLYDRAMIKDTHRSHLAKTSSLAEAVERIRAAKPDRVIEVEVESLDQLADVLIAKPDWVLIDNKPPEELKAFVERAQNTSKTEASGGITLESIRQVAATGVDAISIGALTHSCPSADFSLEWEQEIG